MAVTELLEQKLPVEPDLQHFLRFVLDAATQLGANPFSTARASLDLAAGLRAAGAASGLPLPARLLLDRHALVVEWGEAPSRFPLATLAGPPEMACIQQVRRQLQQSTAMSDPDLLLQRNIAMIRYLDETRARTEAELKKLQDALEQRQTELWESVRQAETDPLTGLLNRRAFDERIGVAFKRTQRQKGEALSLVLLDLDFFKAVNDKYGHQFGDAYLNKMAHAMQESTRQDVDYAFRVGGDEFALLIFADRRTACKKSLQILAMMDEKVSIGITAVSPQRYPNDTLKRFIKRADNALYAAKRAGRGQIVMDRCGVSIDKGCRVFCGED